MCRKCPRLVEWRESVAVTKRAAFRDEKYWGRPVPGFGDPEARLIVVGLAPAAHGANRTGRMFTGDRSGDVLYAAMHRSGFASQPTSVSKDDGLVLHDAWVTSPVKCAPPANKPTVEERDTCRPFLETELDILPWRVVLVLGGFGFGVMASVLGISPRPKFGHGVEIPLSTTCSDALGSSSTPPEPDLRARRPWRSRPGGRRRPRRPSNSTGSPCRARRGGRYARWGCGGGRSADRSPR